MTTKDDGGPAFPVNTNGAIEPAAGISARDWFATHASERDIHSGMTFGGDFENCDARAQARYRFADAMIEARNR